LQLGVLALRQAGLTPNDGPVTIKGEANGVYEGNVKGTIFSLKKHRNSSAGSN
jgi:hypothetical protein